MGASYLGKLPYKAMRGIFHQQLTSESSPMALEQSLRTPFAFPNLGVSSLNPKPSTRARNGCRPKLRLRPLNASHPRLPEGESKLMLWAPY